VTARRAACALAALLALIVAGCGTKSAAPQATLHVDADRARCDDGRSVEQARSADKPLCTIARALRLARNGAVIALAPGSYPPLEVSGARDAWVTIEGDGAAVIPRIAVANGATHLAFSGLRLTGSPAGPTFQIGDGARDVRLERSRVQAARQDAVVLAAGASQVTIAGNRIHTTGTGSGVTFGSTSTLPGSPPGAQPEAPITDVAIRANHFDGIATDAIRPSNFVRLTIDGNEIEGLVENGQHADAVQTVFGGRDLVVRNNFIHDNRAQGLFIKDGQVTNALIEGNVIVHNKAELALQLYDTVGVRIVNNTVWDNELNVALRTGVRDAVVSKNLFENMVVEDPASAAAEVRQDHNVIAGGWNWGARGPHDVTTMPSFVNRGAEDYRLRSGCSSGGMGAFAAASRRDACAS
jgi:parallel beta helix pectate lyase-like protein